MANIINTRIINKNDLWSNWESSNLQLKEGEITLAKLTAKTTDAASGKVSEYPIYVMKVGMEGKTFAESPWLYAPASDVHEWAKAAKPEDVTFFKDLSEDVVDLNSAVLGNTGLVGKVSALETKVGDTTVANAISAAIAQLGDTPNDLDDTKTQFVKAVTQENGKVTVTYVDIQASDITGLQDFIENLVGANVSGLGQTVTNLSDKVDDIEEVVKELDETTIPGINDRLADLDELVGENATSGLRGEVANLWTQVGSTGTTGLRGTVAEHGTAIGNLQQKLQDVSNVMDFRGTVKSLPTSTEGYQNGDVIVVTGYTAEELAADSELTQDPNVGKEFVLSGTAWVEFGNSTAEQSRLTAIENDIDDLETFVFGEGTEGQAGYVAGVDAKLALKLDSATYSGNRAEDLQKIQNNTDAIGDADSGLTKEVNTLKSTVGDDKDGLVKDVTDLKTTVGSSASGLVKELADDKKNLADNYYTKVQVDGIEAGLEQQIEGKADNSVVTGINDRVTTLETTVNGKAAVGTEGDDDYVPAVVGLVEDVNTIKTTLNGKDAVGTEGETGYVPAVVGLVDTVAAHTTKFDRYVLNADLETKVTDSTVGVKVSTIESKYISFNTTNDGFVVNGSDVEVIFDCGGAQ